MRYRKTAGWALAAALCLVSRAGSQTPHLAIGNILLSSEKLADPNFAESVVLLVQYDEAEGTVGLIVNRQTEMRLSQIFPKAKHASADPVYMGGPVGIMSAQALVRLPAKEEGATQISGDIYLTGTKDLIEKSIASRLDSSKFRLYLGYAGWAPGQLEMEIRVGAWSVLSGSSKIVFDPRPDSLWSRLVHESHMQIARTRSAESARALLTGSTFDQARVPFSR